MDKLSSKWEFGIFVGIRQKSGEIWVADRNGVHKARSVRRLAKQDRWTTDSVSWVRNAPWNRYKGQEDADGDIVYVEPEIKEPAAPQPAPLPQSGREVPPVVVKMKVAPPRAFQIRKEDADKHGYTRGCAGCQSWFRGLGRQPHTTACRDRFAELMKDEARFKNALIRKDEYEEKVEKKRARKEKKKEDEKTDEAMLEQKVVKDSKVEGLPKETSEGTEMKDIGDQKGLNGEIDVEMKGDPAASSGLTEAQRREGQGPQSGASSGAEVQQEKRDGDELDGSWDEFAERLKKRQRSAQDMELGMVGKIPEDAVWEELVDADLECKMIQEIRVQATGVFGDVLVEEYIEGEVVDGWAWDDVKDQALDVKKVRAARQEEIQYMMKKGVWKEVDIQECWDRTGKAPVTVKWVDTDKGQDGEEAIRSRLVARDFRAKGEKDREDLFAATPPLELLRLLISKTATRVKEKGVQKMVFIDVKKAHLNPKCEQDVYFWIPDEANPTAGKCGKLEFWLYGFRPAAQAWEELYASKLMGVGFVRGDGSPVAFYHPERDLAVVVHGDDFTFSGTDSHLDWIELLMKGWFEVKVRARLGPDVKDDKEIVILGRLVRWETDGITYQADPKHRRIVMEKFGLTAESKALTVNGKADDPEEDEEELTAEEATEFRSVAARLNFAAQDCPDIQFPTKEACREMASPTPAAWGRVKRLARYLLGREAAVLMFEWLYEEPGLDTYTDSDWAGCRRTRRSTSGGVIMRGPHCIKTWSTTQGPLALSSAEAEYYSMVEGVLKAKGVQTFGKEIGIRHLDSPIVLHTDSSAAKSFACRRGLGRMRHIDTKCLWLQAAVLDRQVLVRKVAGTRNPANALTKYLGADALSRECGMMSVLLQWRPRA